MIAYMTPDEAIAFAAKLVQSAHLVKEAAKDRPESYMFLRIPDDARLKFRIGSK